MARTKKPKKPKKCQVCGKKEGNLTKHRITKNDELRYLWKCRDCLVRETPPKATDFLHLGEGLTYPAKPHVRGK